MIITILSHLHPYCPFSIQLHPSRLFNHYGIIPPIYLFCHNDPIILSLTSIKLYTVAPQTIVKSTLNLANVFLGNLPVVHGVYQLLAGFRLPSSRSPGASSPSHASPRRLRKNDGESDSDKISRPWPGSCGKPASTYIPLPSFALYISVRTCHKTGRNNS